jgi:tetratricopeptide (TPR) repeat protein
MTTEHRRILLTFALLMLLAGCRGGPSGAPAEPDRPAALAVGPGITVVPYGGVFRDYRPMQEAIADLPATIESVRETLVRRLGLRLDPDRPRTLRFDDDRESTLVETRAVQGRLVQEILVPSPPLAQRRVPAPLLLRDALAAAAMSDPPNESLPGWYRRGAPLWVSGLWERELMRRALGGPSVVLTPDRVSPPLELADMRPDSLSAGLFVKFVADEFGADRLPALTRALVAAESPEEALAAALGTDPAALPVAYDGYRLRVVSDITDDPFVRELAAIRDRSPADRVERLTGLSARAPSRWVGAAIQEMLGLSQFEMGDYEGAARTLSAVERDYPLHALHPDRDRLYFALCYVRRGEHAAAALRLETFLAEFPASEYASLALFELGSLLLETGRTEDALARYEELRRRFPQDPLTRRAVLVLAAYEKARHRYGLAAGYLEQALPDPEAQRQLVALRPLLEAPLAEAAVGLVDQALRGLLSSSEEEAERGVRTLAEVGPAAGVRLWRAVAEANDREAYLRAVAVVSAWPRAQAQVWLARLLTVDDDAVASAVFDAFLESGATPDQLGSILDMHPDPTPAANRVYEERYGSSVRGLRSLLASENHLDRVEAARRLAGDDRPAALRALVGLSADPSPQVRRAAAAALGLREEGAAGEVLLRCLEDDSALVRFEAMLGLLRRKAIDPVRDRCLGDPDPRIRLEAARRLFDLGTPDLVERVIELLGDSDGGVASGVEAMLKTGHRPSLGPALAEGLRAAERPGLAMRIVRVMTHHVGRDLGYDPGGGTEERTRIAMEFLRWWEEVSEPR